MPEGGEERNLTAHSSNQIKGDSAPWSIAQCTNVVRKACLQLVRAGGWEGRRKQLPLSSQSERRLGSCVLTAREGAGGRCRFPSGPLWDHKCPSKGWSIPQKAVVATFFLKSIIAWCKIQEQPWGEEPLAVNAQSNGLQGHLTISLGILLHSEAMREGGALAHSDHRRLLLRYTLLNLWGWKSWDSPAHRWSCFSVSQCSVQEVVAVPPASVRAELYPVLWKDTLKVPTHQRRFWAVGPQVIKMFIWSCVGRT